MENLSYEKIIEEVRGQLPPEKKTTGRVRFEDIPMDGIREFLEEKKAVEQAKAAVNARRTASGRASSQRLNAGQQLLKELSDMERARISDAVAELDENLRYINDNYKLQLLPLREMKPVSWHKKLFRKFANKIIRPVVDGQNAFNAAVVRTENAQRNVFELLIRAVYGED